MNNLELIKVYFGSINENIINNIEDFAFLAIESDEDMLKKIIKSHVLLRDLYKSALERDVQIILVPPDSCRGNACENCRFLKEIEYRIKKFLEGFEELIGTQNSVRGLLIYGIPLFLKVQNS